MTHEVIVSPDLPKPLGAYSPVVRVDNLLFVSAQTGIDPVTGAVPEGGIEAECRQLFVNLDRALQASGSSLDHVVKTTLFYVDLQDLAIINQAYAKAFPADPPARSAAIVGLAGGRRISVDAIAVVA